MNRNLKAVFNLCRNIGIAAQILPRNFPTVDNVKITTVNDSNADWGGYGGTNTRGNPFIIVNIAHQKSLADFIAVMAHEMLHVRQAVCEKIMAHHGNQFRTDCKHFCKLLGVTYYHLNGYDKPSNAAMKAHYQKKIRALSK